MAADRFAVSSEDAPPVVIGAVAAGTVPTPFLAVYAVLFVLRGLFVKTDQPDLSNSHGIEALAGLAIAVFLVLTVVALSRFIGGRAPWLFYLTQLVVLVAAVWLLLDRTSGDPQLPALLLLGSVVALVLGALPPSLRWVGAMGGRPTAAAEESADDPVVARPEPDEQPLFGEIGWADSEDGGAADRSG